jgi:hypothetical protein
MAARPPSLLLLDTAEQRFFSSLLAADAERPLSDPVAPRSLR